MALIVPIPLASRPGDAGSDDMFLSSAPQPSLPGFDVTEKSAKCDTFSPVALPVLFQPMSATRLEEQISIGSSIGSFYDVDDLTPHKL